MKFDCTTCGPELAPYAAGDGSPRTRDALAAHVAACPSCHRELEHEIGLRTTLAGLPLIACPTAVSGRVLGAIERQPSAVRRRRWFVGTGGGVLAAAALAGALLLRPAAPVAPLPGAGGLDVAAAPLYTVEEIAVARRDLIRTMTMTARILDRTGRHTLAEVFSERLPAAVAGSLRPLGDPTRGG